MLGGCNLAPQYNRPDAPVSDRFHAGTAYLQDQEQINETPVSDMHWQMFFKDEKMCKVILLALENNRDLRIAAQNIERARALYGIRQADRLPTVNVTGNGSQQRVPADLSSTGERMTAEQYSVDVGFASWEVDLFGRLKNLSDQALEEFFATQEARQATQILLVSSVADAYMTLAADRETLALAQTTLQAQEDSYNLIKRRFEGGASAEIDVYRAQSQVDSAKQSVARYSQLVAQDENAINFLVGTAVPTELLHESIAQVSPPDSIAIDLSSQVLLNRPDIRAAEHRLKAANANIGAARAAFFPRITLTAAAGTASSELSGLFESGSGTWSFGPQISLPIFDPSLRADLKVSEVDRNIALAEYEKSIQQSFREVADALAVHDAINEQLDAQESYVYAVEQTYRLSNLRYTKGLDNYLSVLDSQRSLYAAQQDLVALRLLKISNQITLYEVFGGGWQQPMEAIDRGQ